MEQQNQPAAEKEREEDKSPHSPSSVIKDGKQPRKEADDNPNSSETLSDPIVNTLLKRSQSAGSQPLARSASLKRAESRLSRQYANVQPKVNSRLEAQYIPESSQIRIPRSKRGSKDLSITKKRTSSIPEGEDPEWNVEDSAQEAESTDGSLTHRSSPMSEKYALSSHSEQYEDYFNQYREGSRDRTYGSESPLGSDTSLTARRRKSRSVENTVGEKNPTSNSADYAKSTNSFQNKISESHGYGTTGLSTSGSRNPPTQRRPQFGKSATMPTIETLSDELERPRGRKVVKFEESMEPQGLTASSETGSLQPQINGPLGQEHGIEPLELAEDDCEDQIHVENQERRHKKQEVSGLAGNSSTRDRQQDLLRELREAQEIIKQKNVQITALKEAMQSKDSLKSLHLRDVEQLEEVTKTVSAQAQRIDELELQLRDAIDIKEVEHAVATGTHSANWHSVYQRGKKVNVAQEDEINHLKESVRKLEGYNAYLERELKESRAYGITQRDTADSLDDEQKRYRNLAESWKHEYEQQKLMREQGNVEEGTETKKLREELHDKIAEYQALMPSKDDPDALERLGLMRKVNAQRALLEQATRHHEKLKKENALLEAEVEKCIATERELLEEIEHLKHGPRPHPRNILGRDNTEKILPEWNFRELAQRRKDAVSEFKTKQKEARDAKEAELKLMEKVREAKMGKWHPPKRRNFEDLQQKSSWERWDGKLWFETKASEDDYETAQRLGLMDEKKNKKGWSTQDWKGKSLSSMGLKSPFKEEH